jgi:hypothetical protein
MASLRNLDDPVIVSLLEHSPNFYLRNFPEASIISTGMAVTLLLNFLVSSVERGEKYFSTRPSALVTLSAQDVSAPLTNGQGANGSGNFLT